MYSKEFMRYLIKYQGGESQKSAKTACKIQETKKNDICGRILAAITVVSSR